MDNQHHKSQLKAQQILYREGSGTEEPMESCDPEKYISYIWNKYIHIAWLKLRLKKAEFKTAHKY